MSVVGTLESRTGRRRSRRNRSRGLTPPRFEPWWLICAGTVLAALALGAIHPTTLIVVSVLPFAAAAIVVSRHGFKCIPAPAWVLFGLAAYTALQALPLPAALVRALSPHAAQIWRDAFELSGKTGWMSLSLDRGATMVEVLKWTMYGAAFVAAANYGARRGMLRGLLLPVGAATAVALVTLIHGLAGAETIYGFYEPSVPRSIWHMGPLLNPNHLASYLNFGIFCAFGIAAVRRPLVPPWAVGLIIAFLMPNAIVAGSRGGIVGLVVGLLIFWLAQPKATHADASLGPVPKLALIATMASVFALAIGLTGLLATERTARQLYEVNVDKLRLLGWCQHLIADYPWFGIGRGAFESVFSAYRTGRSNEIYSHPENLPAQWLGEWGVPVALAAAACFVYYLRPRRLGVRWSVAASGVVAALSAMLTQNFVDFGLEVPAVALTVTVALAVCWGQADARRRGAPDGDDATSLRRLVGIGAGCVALLGLVIAFGGRALVYERRALAEAYESTQEPNVNNLRALRDMASELVAAHPAEPYFFRMGALLTWRIGENPLRWFGTALERGPEVGRTHLLLARYLASERAIGQALLELRLAGTFDPNLVPATARAASAWSTTYDGVIRAVPEAEAGTLMLTLLSRETTDKPELRERLLSELVNRDPKRFASLQQLADFLLSELGRGDASERCGGERRNDCLTRADQTIASIERVAPQELQTVLLRSRFFEVSGESQRALGVLNERCKTLPTAVRPRCLKRRLELAFAEKTAADFAVAAKEYLADACGDSDQCAESLERVADLSSGRGDWDAALAFYERAARERSEDRLWLKVARAGARVAAFSRVTNALARIREPSHFEPEYSKLMKSVTSSRTRAP